MKDLIKKLQDAGKEEVLQSKEKLMEAAKELGYSDEEIDQIVSEFNFPLDDSKLDEVTGGLNIYMDARSAKRPDLFYPKK